MASIWLASRAVMAMLTVWPPAWLGPPGNADVLWLYDRWHNLLYAGLLPWRDFNVEYPVGALPLFALPGRTTFAYGEAFLAAAMMADAIVMIALIKSGRRYGACGWVLLPCALGPLFWGRLDVFVVTTLVGAALAVDRGRWRLAILLIYAAGALKLWPWLLFVPALRLVPRRHRLLLSAEAFGLLLATVSLVWALGMWPGQRAMLAYHAHRGLESESFWALPLLLVSRVVKGVTIVSAFGSNDVNGPGAQLLLIGSSALLALAVVTWIIWVVRRPRNAFDSEAALLIALVLVCGKVFSAQYVTWLLAAAVLLLDRTPDRARLWAGSLAAAMTVQLTLNTFTPLFKVTALTPWLALVHGAGLAYGVFVIGHAAVSDVARARPMAEGTLTQVWRNVSRGDPPERSSPKQSIAASRVAIPRRVSRADQKSQA
jgi:hypothetical protein